MERKSNNQTYLHPNSQDGNDNDEVSSTSSAFDMDLCCSSCCSCDNNAGTDVESSILNPLNPQDFPEQGRAMSHKIDILKCLSLARTNRERAAIPNVLQFIEALTYSNSFVRRYNTQDYQCVRCVRGQRCECYEVDDSHLSLVGSCSCSRCDGPSETSEDSASSGRKFPDFVKYSDYSLVLKEPTRKKRSKNARNRRLQARRRNSTAYRSVNTLGQVVANPERNSNSSQSNEDSDYYHDRRLVRWGNPSRFELTRCYCDECMRAVTVNNSRNNASFYYSDNDYDECSSECFWASGIAQSTQQCNIPNCCDCSSERIAASRNSQNRQPGMIPNCQECQSETNEAKEFSGASSSTCSEDTCSCSIKLSPYDSEESSWSHSDVRSRGEPEGQTDPGISDCSGIEARVDTSSSGDYCSSPDFLSSDSEERVRIRSCPDESSEDCNKDSYGKVIFKKR